MALEGTLNYLDIAHLLQVVGTSKKTGILEITCQERQARLYFEGGGLVRAESNRAHDGIGTLLVKAGELTPEQLDAALAAQREDPRKRRLGALLCDEFGIGPETLQRALRGQFQDIVFDVFSWPGGSFVFQFTSPEEIEERFTLDAAAFILEVGVQAGLLAEEGMDREGSEPGRTPVALLVGDPVLEATAAEIWRRKGHPVVACERLEELRGFLAEESAAGARCPVALVGVGLLPADPASGGLPPGAAVVALGADPAEEAAARRRGAGGFVCAPAASELEGGGRDAHLEVFALRLEKAFHQVLASRSGGPDGE